MKETIKQIFPKSFRLWLRYQAFKIRSLKYSGNKATCNICQRSFSKMLAKSSRESAVCPYCNSLERQRFMVYYLEHEILKNRKLNETLYFSPLPALHDRLKSMKGMAHIITGDIDPTAADEIVDITSIGYSDRFFDLVICSHVLAHIPNEKQAISELYRVVKRGGMVFIFTNYELGHLETIELNSESKQTAFNVESDTLRIHGVDLKERLEQVGFTVDLLTPDQFASPDELKKYNMRKEDVLFYCTIA